MNQQVTIKQLCISLLVTAIAVSLLAVPIKKTFAEKPRYGGIFKFIRGYSPMAPGWPSSSAGLDITELYACLEPLLIVDKNGNPAPFLATSWEYSPDLKSLTLKLRKSVKFHDGSDFNAEVVKMNLEERKDGLTSRGIKTIESVDVIDERTVRINLTEYKNVLLGSLTTYNGLMVSPKVIEKAKTKKGKKWAKKHPVGTGPFKFVKFERGVILKYERFDGYWQKGRPYLDGVETHYIKDRMTALAALRAGEVHALWEAPADNAAVLKGEGFVIIHMPAAIGAFATDSGNPESVFANKKVREALEYAINKKAVTDGLGYGYWEPLNQYSSKDYNGHNPDLRGRPYNPEKAKQLLREAGYPNGFKTKLIAGTISYGRDLMALLQRYLKEVGIDAKLEFYNSGKYTYALMKGYKDGIMIYRQTYLKNQTDELNNLFKKGSARFPNLFRPLELQEVLAKAEKQQSHETEAALTRKAVKLISENAVALPLFTYHEMYILNKIVNDPGFNYGRRGQWSPAGCWLSE